MSAVKPILIAFLFLSISCSAAFGAKARVWQENLTIPTYALGAEDQNPPFDLTGGHHVYPYPMLDDLTDRLEQKSYKAVFLENEYLKAVVLPEMGGHVYSLYDKVNKREVLYRNNVVKYGLVALRGAWVSGGIEFNFPNGHSVVTVSPVAFTAFQNPDGSATVVVGDMDQVTEMHWEVALTLHPGEARLEQHVTLFNSTALTNLYWFWATTAVPATQDMQFIYPMREAFPHLKGEVWSYPMHDGADYSWYKNVRQPTSLFGRQVHRTFFGAYYHQSNYGVVHAADFREVTGKKTWTWGTADDGLIWTDLLTDHDGAYNEIQAGRYETQLNYEFMPPRHVETFTEYWYPVAGLDGGFVEATSQLALNVNFVKASAGVPGHAEILLFPTVAIRDVKVRVKLGAQTLKDAGPLSLAPMTTSRLSVPVEDSGAAPKKLEVDVTAPDGQTVLHWSAADPIDGNPDFVPAANVSAPAPKPLDKLSVEELYLCGVGEEKDGDERRAVETYRAVLDRDPGHVAALRKLAWHEFRRGDFRAAEGLIARALARDGFSPETNYAAGVIYRAAQRWTLAQDAFWASIHYGGAEAPAYAQLGELSLRVKKYDEATTLFYQALARDPYDGVTLADLAVAQRLSGRLTDAARSIAQGLSRMPLLPYARAERWRIEAAVTKALAKPAEHPPEDWAKPYPAAANPYLEAAAWYRALGDVVSSDAVLESALGRLPASSITPLVYYYLAANARDEGKSERAEQFARKGQEAPYAAVFPNRMEDAAVIDAELHDHPSDSHASYLLGNYLFAHGRYDDAGLHWSDALGQGLEYSVLMRNLGVHAWRVKNDLPGAAGFYEKAVKLAPDDFRLYVDLDEIYFRLGNTSGREKLFASAPASVLERDSVRVRRVLLLTQEQQYDQALGLLANHNFKAWEGGVLLRQMYVLACVAKGKHALASRQLPEAEAALREALKYPHNLGVGKPDKPHDEEALFWLGETLKAAGNDHAARDAWAQAAQEGTSGGEASKLYRGLALRRLGQPQEAEAVLAPFEQTKPADKHSAQEFYAAGLLNLADDRSDLAAGKFTAALNADPDFWPARLALVETNR